MVVVGHSEFCYIIEYIEEVIISVYMESIINIAKVMLVVFTYIFHIHNYSVVLCTRNSDI